MSQLYYCQNYEIFGLRENPELAAEPERAAQIAVQGMVEGRFTGVRLDRYVNDQQQDFKNARRVILGLNRARLIAGHAEGYFQALKDCGYTP